MRKIINTPRVLDAQEFIDIMDTERCFTEVRTIGDVNACLREIYPDGGEINVTDNFWTWSLGDTEEAMQISDTEDDGWAIVLVRFVLESPHLTDGWGYEDRWMEIPPEKVEDFAKYCLHLDYIYDLSVMSQDKKGGDK